MTDRAVWFACLVSCCLASSSTVAPPPTTLYRDVLKSPPSPPPSSPFDSFRHDVSQIGSINSPITSGSKRDSSYSKLWNSTDWEEHCAHSLARYIRHMLRWPHSTTAAYVMPTVLVVSVWSAIVVKVVDLYPNLLGRLGGGSGALGVSLAPILLLLTLKTNRSMDRLLEARKTWGLMTRASRSLMGLCCTYLLPLDETNGSSSATNCTLLIGRYLSIFPWVLKGTLRGEDDEELIRRVLPPNEADWVLKSPAKRPSAIVVRIRNLIAQQLKAQEQKSSQPSTVLTIGHLQMEERLCDLETSFGRCYRIYTSPIPPTYTRHTSRVLFLHLLLLPLGLVGATSISPLLLILTCALTSYVLVGIDEIGLEVEHAFPMMPLQPLAKRIQGEILNQVILVKTLPS